MVPDYERENAVAHEQGGSARKFEKEPEDDPAESKRWNLGEGGLG